MVGGFAVVVCMRAKMGADTELDGARCRNNNKIEKERGVYNTISSMIEQTNGSNLD